MKQPGRLAVRLNRHRGIVCLVTDRRLMGGQMMETIVAAARAQVDLIQIRERDLDGGALSRLVREAVEATRGSSAIVVVNDRLDVALASGAGGVHLRGDSFPASKVRTVVPDGFIIGRSVQSTAEAEGAAGADYLIFGTVFASASKPPNHTVAGPGGLRRVCASVDLPVLAIGGMTVEHAGTVAAAGAAGVAGISLFAGSSDPGHTIRSLRAAFDKG